MSIWNGDIEQLNTSIKNLTSVIGNNNKLEVRDTDSNNHLKNINKMLIILTTHAELITDEEISKDEIDGNHI